MRACRPDIVRHNHHINYYFDCERLRLRKKKFGLRIRILNKKNAIVTLKFPAKNQVGPKVRSLKIRKEYEEVIPFKVAKEILNGNRSITDLKITSINVLKRAFRQDHLDRLAVLGSVETLRTLAKLPDGTEIELDSFKMFGKQFFELEVETENPLAADRAVRGLFHEFGIPYHPINKSKLGRFLDHWKKAGRRHATLK